MKDTTLAIRIEGEVWKGFKTLARLKGRTASEALRALMQEAVEREDSAAGVRAFLEMGGEPDEGHGPADLAARKDAYLYGKPSRRSARRRR